MATVTASYPKKETFGSKNLYIWRITDIDDAETVDTGLGSRLREYWITWTGNPGTQASASGHSTESGGTITFYPGTDALGATLFVMGDAG
jgi:hypothetical protein